MQNKRCVDIFQQTKNALPSYLEISSSRNQFIGLPILRAPEEERLPRSTAKQNEQQEQLSSTHIPVPWYVFIHITRNEAKRETLPVRSRSLQAFFCCVMKCARRSFLAVGLRFNRPGSFSLSFAAIKNASQNRTPGLWPGARTYLLHEAI